MESGPLRATLGLWLYYEFQDMPRDVRPSFKHAEGRNTLLDRVEHQRRVQHRREVAVRILRLETNRQKAGSMAERTSHIPSGLSLRDLCENQERQRSRAANPWAAMRDCAASDSRAA